MTGLQHEEQLLDAVRRKLGCSATASSLLTSFHPRPVKSRRTFCVPSVSVPNLSQMPSSGRPRLVADRMDGREAWLVHRLS
jgi:hypothetical protein